MRNKIASYSSVCATLFLCACSTNPLTISLSELGTATKSDVGSIGIHLTRSVNVTGLGAAEVVGSYTIDPDPNFFHIPVPWGTTHIPDTLFPRVIPGCNTMVVETKFPDAKLADVVAVRDSLFKLTEMQLQEVNYKIQLEVLNGLQSSGMNAASVVPPEAVAITGVNGETLEQGINRLKTEMDAANNQIKELKDALDKALSTGSIVVTNWSRTEKMQADASAADGAATAGMQKSKQMSGYLVLGSPRVASLIVGKDLLDEINRQQSGELSSLKDQGNLYITQHTLSAKQLAWTESRSGSFEARVKAQFDKIISALSGLPSNVKNSISAKLNALKVSAGFGWASAYSATSTGALATVTDANNQDVVKTGDKAGAYHFSFLGNDYPQALLAEMSRSKDYRNVYTSRATLVSLVGKINNVGNVCSEQKVNSEVDDYFNQSLLPNSNAVSSAGQNQKPGKTNTQK